MSQRDLSLAAFFSFRQQGRAHDAFCPIFTIMPPPHSPITLPTLPRNPHRRSRPVPREIPLLEAKLPHLFFSSPTVSQWRTKRTHQASLYLPSSFPQVTRFLPLFPLPPRSTLPCHQPHPHPLSCAKARTRRGRPSPVVVTSWVSLCRAPFSGACLCSCSGVSARTPPRVCVAPFPPLHPPPPRLPLPHPTPSLPPQPPIGP